MNKSQIDDRVGIGAIALAASMVVFCLVLAVAHSVKDVGWLPLLAFAGFVCLVPLACYLVGWVIEAAIEWWRGLWRF